MRAERKLRIGRLSQKTGQQAWMAGYDGQKPSRKNDPLHKIQIKMVDRSYSRLAVMVVTTKRGAARDGDSGNHIVVWALIAGRCWKFRHAQTWKHSRRWLLSVNGS
jgi:hypothetical protein